MLLPQDDREEAKFAMAPMIDMVFLLLVFFMTASHLSAKKNLQMEIPDATKGVIPTERPDRYVVNIDKEGTLYSGLVPVDLDELKDLVVAKLAGKPDLKVYLRADANTEHQDIKKVMGAMAEAGIDQFIFGVYAPDE